MKGDCSGSTDLVSDKPLLELLVIHYSNGLPQPGLYILCIYTNMESSLASRHNAANGICANTTQKLSIIKYSDLSPTGDSYTIL